ncbi:response regulator transcription factor [Flavobacterium zepuense]|uniref:Response regulator transcription factor n=1 Tax=Flavobacterium zepuense TaxID=2593302 RepID=A0A552UX38_9FLAO|nr:response regulator [Flavobacterium zepuense]TRW22777.1 response regulator transcription factor [Flavobacterium zepuense]
MKKRLHALAIDDHVVVLEGYHFMFKNLKYNFNELNFVKAHDCKTGYEAIQGFKGKPFDIALIDYSIPPFPENKLFTGEDLAMQVRETMPKCKIILMTMHKEIDVIGSILQKVKPEGFINKSDCTTDELIHGFEEVLSGGTFYSKTVSDYIARRSKGVVLEDIDVRIILLLAKGVKNKNLGNYIPLSDSAIEKRKYKIKRLLEVKDDEELIDKARDKGYI